MAAPPSADLWDGGWHRDAVRLPSSNYGPRPADARQSVDLVVVHSISLPPGHYGTGAVQQLFTNTLDWDVHPYFQQIRGLQVSAHFFIERSGRLWQFVDCDQRAWHAGQSAYRGRTNCNDDSIGIELEGLEGHRFESAQYLTLAALCHALAERYPLRYLAGHEHVAPGRKQDPGPGFDWRKLAELLAKSTLKLPSQVPPT
ncbi:MAG: 1,6-anhydro-N-acetylmuramyl-L-alanine amidase AmpD [Acidovorax sp.]|nr:1,6-anhydro-N-acetylmuramyl-L-alanine amidase AmpD [Acidovorax sp.]